MLTIDAFKRTLSKVLEDAPRGTTADLTDCMIAYWNGYN